MWHMANSLRTVSESHTPPMKLENMRSISKVSPFAGAQRMKASTGGGASIRWRRDGKELFYIALDKKLMAVEIKRVAHSISKTFVCRVGIFAAPYR